MHHHAPRRFNRAADLVGAGLGGNFGDLTDVMARIYVWLRYSATRQLTWQRNYNTQPRILSSAQDRLTSTIASAHGKTHGAWPGWAGLGCC